MTSIEDKEARETALAIDRALREGSVWLNPVFRFQDRPIRIFRRRVTPLEIFWGILSGILTALILIGLSFVFGSGGIFIMVFNPVAIVGWSIIAMFIGRRIAFMSPLRRQTGEGTGVWIVTMTRRVITRVSFAFSRPVMYNYCDSRAGNIHLKMQRVECIEWLGTAHSPRAPIRTQEGNNLYQEVELRPRGVSIRSHKNKEVNW